MKNTISLILLSTSLLISCGKDEKSSKSNSGVIRTPALEEQAAEGSYRAILRPFNNHLSGFLPTGVAEIKISGDSVQVKTLLDDDARVVHIQSIHQGTACPSILNDTNQDGLIDIAEAQVVSGKVFISLDGNINSEEEGAGLYPFGGDFTYIENASLSKFESDVKARTGQGLNLSGRVVLIHGVNGATQLPDSVATIGTLNRQASIPIACGILKREL